MDWSNEKRGEAEESKSHGREKSELSEERILRKEK